MTCVLFCFILNQKEKGAEKKCSRQKKKGGGGKGVCLRLGSAFAVWTKGFIVDAITTHYVGGKSVDGILTITLKKKVTLFLFCFFQGGGVMIFGCALVF